FPPGLSSMDFVEGRNIATYSRYADNHRDRPQGLAPDPLRRQAAPIYVTDNPATASAKAATATIPNAVRIGATQIQVGRVAGLTRPGGNMTGVRFFVTTP